MGARENECQISQNLYILGKARFLLRRGRGGRGGSLRVDELSLYFSHHKITFKGKKAEKVAMTKAHIGSLLYNSMERQQPQQLPLTNLRQQVTSISLSKVETDSQSDIVDQVVGSSPCSLSEESSPETDFIPEPCAETSRYG